MTTDTLRARVEQAQALAAAATPGPWGIMGGHNDYWIQAFDGGRVDGWPTGQKIVQLETWEPATKQGDAKLMAAAPDLVGLVTDLWAAYVTRAQDASVAVARACLERDEARRSLAVAQADLAVARAVDAEHLQRAVRAEQERDAARTSASNFDDLIGRCWAALGPLSEPFGLVDAIARTVAERDAALAEVARLRGEAEAGVAKTLHGTVWGASMSSDSGDPDFDGLGYVEVYAPREDIAGVIVGRGSKAMVVIYEWREPVEVSDG